MEKSLKEDKTLDLLLLIVNWNDPLPTHAQRIDGFPIIINRLSRKAIFAN
jgi:hypothetical protein